MKAFVARSYRTADLLELTDLATPVPADDEILVRVRATSINPYDWHHLRGEPRVARLMPDGPRLRRPRYDVLGCDVAGQVEAVGRDVTRFRPGDDVYALVEQGGFAEYVTVPEHLLAPKPKNLSYEQTAAIPMAGATALLGVREVGRLRPGQRILVNGASGGVGTFAVQLARALGANVTGVCGTRNLDLIRRLGADEILDYRTADFTRAGQRYDLVLDVAGNRSLRACRRVLAPDATYAVVGGPAGRWLQPVGHMVSTFALAPLVPARVALVDTVRCDTKRGLLETLTELVEDGKLTPVVDRRYPFDELPAALAYQERGHPVGKVVVTI
ncbi:NAD(P)-dependent alcohol dehydrogenase [Micromonospora sp. NPDC049559]|uniref:NAD(P)-dependent alcohol dehydrogenase n=1 Tax=Micromonospora sp. NPDC049559 TaxID=3155923 RepID=UPI00343B7E19